MSDWLHIPRGATTSASHATPPHRTPPQKLRTVRSHASALRPVARFARDPLAGITAVAQSIGLIEAHSAYEQSRRVQLHQMQAAKTREEWERSAQELDRIEGKEAWKDTVESTDYDFELIQLRLRRLENAYARRDYQELRHLIRTSLTRDLGGMGDSRLYRHTYMGTKRMIERYNEIILATLDILVQVSGHGPHAKLDARQLQDQMKQVRQAFGRSALLLSGGGTFGMNHIGVVKCLFEVELLPRIISGASAGSIVAAVVCAKTDEEVPDVLHTFCTGPLDVFEADDNPASNLGRAVRFLKTGAVYDVANLKRVMRDLLGDLTFLEAYNRTQRILNICVSTAGIYDQPRLLNYITAPDVVIWSAVAASCSVPGIFTSAQLLVRDGDSGEQRPWDDTASKLIDGSVDNDLPMTRLAEMLNVNHFIVSQVNPHVVPFLPKHEDELVADTTAAKWSGSSWLQSTANLAKGEALHRLHVMAELGLWPGMMTKLRSILGQRYSGDITILPELSYAQFPMILSNPTPEFMLQAMYNGERATWPKLSRIRNHLAVELALDKAVHQLIARVAFSPSQVDARLGMFHRRPAALRAGERLMFDERQRSAQNVLPAKSLALNEGGFDRDTADATTQRKKAPASDSSSKRTDAVIYQPSPISAIALQKKSRNADDDSDGEDEEDCDSQIESETYVHSRRLFASQPSTPMCRGFIVNNEQRPAIKHVRALSGGMILSAQTRSKMSPESLSKLSDPGVHPSSATVDKPATM